MRVFKQFVGEMAAAAGIEAIPMKELRSVLGKRLFGAFAGSFNIREDTWLPSNNHQGFFRGEESLLQAWKVLIAAGVLSKPAAIVAPPGRPRPSLRGLTLMNAELSDIPIGLSFRSAKVEGTSFEGCDFTGSVFEGAVFYGCNFNNCHGLDARKAKFQNCHFEDASAAFADCKLHDCSLQSAVLSHDKTLFLGCYGTPQKGGRADQFRVSDLAYLREEYAQADWELVPEQVRERLLRSKLVLVSPAWGYWETSPRAEKLLKQVYG